MTDDAIPAGMKPWVGGDAAPADWDGDVTLRRDGHREHPRRWAHDPRHPFGDTIAYTPAASPDGQAKCQDCGGTGDNPTPVKWPSRYCPTCEGSGLAPAARSNVTSSDERAREGVDRFMHAAEPILSNERDRWDPDEWMRRLNKLTVGDWRALHAALAASRPTEAGAGTSAENAQVATINAVFAENINEQASRLGVHPVETESPGWWQQRVRKAAILAALATPNPPVDEPWPGYTADQDKRRVVTLAKLGLMLSVMAGGEAPEVTGFDAADLYGEVLMALGIEDTDDPDIALQVARDDPEGHMLSDGPKPPVDATQTFDLVWISAARPPVHPEPMTGRQTFTSFEHAMKFMGNQPDDAQFVSLHSNLTRRYDRTADALAAIEADRNLTGDGAGA